jgi:hypothetical protein
MKKLIIIVLMFFAGIGYSQNIFNEAKSGTVSMDGTWKALYIGKGYKTVIVVNKSAYTLSVAFQKDGKRDTSNAITWIKSGSTPIFSSQVCDSMFFKATGDSVQYTVMYGQGIGFNYVGVDNLPDSIIIRSTHPLETDIKTLPLTTKSYSCSDTIAGDWIDTLSATIQGVLETPTSEISLTNFEVGGTTVGFANSYYLAIVTDDTLELSYDIAFTRGTVITIKPGSWKSSDVKFYDIAVFPDWYIRRKGTAETVEYNVTVEGQ